MRVLVRKALRDLRRSKLRTLAIISAIVFSVSLGIAMVNATSGLVASYEERFAVTGYEDISVKFDMTKPDLLALAEIPGIEAVVPRLFLPTRVLVGSESFKTNWIASGYHPEKPYARLDGYVMVEGGYPSSPLARECVVGNQFAAQNHVSVGDTIGLSYGNVSASLRVAGIAASPEYAYVISDSGWPEPGKLLPLFTSYELALDLLGLENGTANQVLVRTSPGASPADVMPRLVDAMMGLGMTGLRPKLGTQEPDYVFSHSDANALAQMGWAFGIIILGVTAVVIYNTMNRLIASQRPYIGVMGALGGRRSVILAHYTLFGFLMGLVGTAIGIPLGILASRAIISATSGIIGLTTLVYPVDWKVVLLFGIFGTAIATLGSGLGALKVISIGPRDALSGGFQAEDFSRPPFFEKLMAPFLSGRILARVPVRALGRNRIRTLVTMLSLAASLILVFASLAMTLGFNTPLERNYNDYETWDLKVTLLDPQPLADLTGGRDQLASRGLTSEGMVDTWAPVRHGGGLEFVEVQAFQENTTMRHYNVIAGEIDFGRGVLVGSILAKRLGVGAGDTIVVVLDGANTTEFTITGITGELMDNSILMTLGQFWSLPGGGGGSNGDGGNGGNGNVTSLLVKLPAANSGGAGSGVSDLLGNHSLVESIIGENFEVSTFSWSADIVTGLQSLLGGVIAILTAFIVVGVLVEVLFVGTTVILNILEREGEFVSLRAMGARPMSIRSIIVGESLLLLAGALVLGLPAAYFTTGLAIDYMIGDLMYYRLTPGTEVFILSSLVAIIATALSAWISARHIDKIDLVEALRRRTG